MLGMMGPDARAMIEAAQGRERAAREQAGREPARDASRLPTARESGKVA
jgi:hypothetical protein